MMLYCHWSPDQQDTSENRFSPAGNSLRWHAPSQDSSQLDKEPHLHRRLQHAQHQYAGMNKVCQPQSETCLFVVNYYLTEATVINV